jgi:hypothetical protein
MVLKVKKLPPQKKKNFIHILYLVFLEKEHHKSLEKRINIISWDT